MDKSIVKPIPISQLLFVIAFNLLPLAGVLLLDWSSLGLLYLYAAENFIILFCSCVKLRLSAFDYLYAYFYLAFCAMQMFFFVNLLGDMQMIFGYDKSLSLLDLNLLVIDQENLYLGLVIMLIIYAIDLIRSSAWFKKRSKQFKRNNKISRADTTSNNEFAVDSIFLSGDIKMFERFALMQITLIVGGALVVFFKTTFFALVILLVLKLSLEIALLEIALRVRLSAQQKLSEGVA